MRILIYGGCHASAFKRILDRYALGDIEVDMLVNFRLVAEKKPFPYEILGNYDLVIFNPILNKAELNTIHLENACKQRNIKYYKYPWLQWEGYWPQARKRYWGKYSEWGMPSVLELTAKGGKDAAADSNATFESYYEGLFEANNFEYAMNKVVEETTRKLRLLEETGNVDIRISDFILENYRKKQLFLTPDHPTNALYKYVIEHMTAAVGIKIDPAFYGASIEIQEGVRTPILPGVAKALNLEFASTEWAHKEFLGNTHYTLRDWAKSSFPGTKMFLGVAKINTRIKQVEGIRKLNYAKQSTVLFTELPNVAVPHHTGALLHGAKDGNFSRALLFRPHWEFFTASM
jgi:Polysaccharide biosynthesis enzyme WcbI